jgi:hypothetical protein
LLARITSRSRYAESGSQHPCQLGQTRTMFVAFDPKKPLIFQQDPQTE